jgi:signal peptidase I
MAEYAAFKLIGRSMEPVLTIGDVILVKKVNVEDLAIADMIVFKNRDSDHVIVHRYIGMHHDGSCMTKPDVTLVQADSYPVSRERVIGKVIAAYRGKNELPVMRSGIMVRLFHRVLFMLNTASFYERIKATGILRGPHRMIMMMRKGIIIRK